MKNTVKRMTAVLAAVGLTACSASGSNASAAAGLYKAGTYTGTGEGKNGTITVEVTFSENAIDAIDIKEHSETPGISDAAISDIPAAIVDSQSLGIDVISGATYTCNGIIDAVKDAVEQAGGSVEDLMNAEVAAKQQTEETLTADVVVVGGGAAGIAAALRANQLGESVILVEKASYLGGALSVSGGNMVVTGSDLQEQAGVTDDSVESMVEDFKKNGANENNEEILTLFAENVDDMTNWLNTEMNVEFDMDGGLHQLGEYSHNRELAYAGGGAGCAETLRADIEASNIETYLNTKAVGLIVEDGEVKGVNAVSNDGYTTYTITAEDVVLACGGYGNSDDMLNEELSSALYYGPETSTGDGIRMAVADADAMTDNMEFGKRYPNGIEVAPGIAKSTIAGNIVGWTMSAILVNAEGERVVNEKSSNRTILETELEQTGGMLYLLLDQETFEVWRTKLAAAGISDENIDNYLASNAMDTPVFANAATLEEVAAVVNMDAETLKNTVERYNSFVEKGEDEDFGRAADYLKKSIGDGPYYLIEQKPRFATTMGGVVVNTNMQVLNTEGNVIPHLYSAGEMCGQVMGDDSPSGANNAWALTSGYLAGYAVHEY